MSKRQQPLKIDGMVKKNLTMWLEGEVVDEETKAAIRKMLQNNPKEIIDAFYTQLSFGTGGLRGIMGIGTNRMNRYTIRITTQGLANYLVKQPIPHQRHAVLIGYDSRHNSKLFAEETAKVLAGNGIRVYLFAELRPTPLVSFGCRYKHCSSAIMITASHNPPQYNGYKVYGKDGGQIVFPHDQAVIEEVKKITHLSMVKAVNDLSNDLIVILDKKIDDAYIKEIKQYQHYPEQNQKLGNSLKIAYTSLHGTGITLVPKTLADWGFTNLVFAESQIIPDGNFPTVKSPNPEEREALKLGWEVLEQENADLLLATDPDADRVGVAVKHKGKVHQLNGNQLACICLYHICKTLTSQKRMPNKAAFVKTIATTELFKIIAEAYQGTCFDVLPGFKYIAEKIRIWEMEPEGFHFVFGGEESCGYLLGTHSRDKDAVITCALICEAALHAKKQHKTLIDNLYEIYQKYGVYYEQLLPLKFEESKQGKEQMAQGLEKLQQNPPKKILDIEVKTIENYQTSLKVNLQSGATEPLTLPKSNALLFWLVDGSKLLIRPSGTEPKIKIYCSTVQKQYANIPEALQDCKVHARNLIQAIQDILILPPESELLNERQST